MSPRVASGRPLPYSPTLPSPSAVSSPPTREMALRSTLIFVPLLSSTRITTESDPGLASTTVPKMPPLLTTWSLFLSADRPRSMSLRFFCSGRIRNRYISSSVAISGSIMPLPAKKSAMPPPPPPPPWASSTGPPGPQARKCANEPSPAEPPQLPNLRDHKGLRKNQQGRLTARGALFSHPTSARAGLSEREPEGQVRYRLPATSSVSGNPVVRPSASLTPHHPPVAPP